MISLFHEPGAIGYVYRVISSSLDE